MRDTEREKQRNRQREKQAPCREPNARLDPRSPGSGPGPKATLNYRPPGLPRLRKFLIKCGGGTGSWVAQLVKRVSLAQVMIPESRDGAHIVLPAQFLPLPLFPHCSLFLSQK